MYIVAEQFVHTLTGLPAFDRGKPDGTAHTMLVSSINNGCEIATGTRWANFQIALDGNCQ